MDAALLQRIDFLQLAIMLGGNRKTIADMLALFLKSASESIETLEAAEKSSNVLLWLQTAHKLKGAGKNITAKRLVGLCLEAEEIHALPHPQASNVIYNLYKELALLREAIAAHLHDKLPKL